MAREGGLHHELVLIDQPQLCQRQRELHACHEQSLTRLPFELLNGLPQIPAHELRVPIDPVQRARHDVLLRCIDRPGEGFHPGWHPIRPHSRPRWRPPRCLHHFVSHPAKEEGFGLLEVLDGVTMQVFVRDHCTMIAASVQRDVDGISKGTHYHSLSGLTPALTGRSEQRETRSGAAACSAIFDPAPVPGWPRDSQRGMVRPAIRTRNGFYRERTTPLPDWRRRVK